MFVIAVWANKLCDLEGEKEVGICANPKRKVNIVGGVEGGGGCCRSCFMYVASIYQTYIR